MLEALNLLPQMGKKERSVALRLFGQTAQFFHLQQEQQQVGEEGVDAGDDGENLGLHLKEGVNNLQKPADKAPIECRASSLNFVDVEPVVNAVLDPTPADLFDDTRLGMTRSDEQDYCSPYSIQQIQYSNKCNRYSTQKEQGRHPANSCKM